MNLSLRKIWRMGNHSLGKKKQILVQQKMELKTIKSVTLLSNSSRETFTRRMYLNLRETRSWSAEKKISSKIQ